MKKFLLFALVCPLVAGCNSPSQLQGTISLSSQTNVLANDGKSYSLAPGAYPTRVGSQGGNIMATITTQSNEVKFAIPNASSEEGSIEISASQLGQEFGLRGKIERATVALERIVDRNCIHHHDLREECYSVPQGGIRCDKRFVPVYGRQPFKQIGSQEIKNVAVDLIRNRKVGSFSGAIVVSEKIESQEAFGECEI